MTDGAGPVRIIPLGGLGEIGKNMTVVESDDGLVLIDAGLAFPRDEMLGVDLVLPDFAYLRRNADRIRAVILTHGHEDHVGALPYVVREVGVPEVWATRLTLGLIKSKLDEHGLIKATELREIEPERGPVRIGPFEAEFVRVTHSIPTPWPSSCARQRAPSSTRATSRSTTRRSTASGPIWPSSDG
jgi:ribonuclease J